MKGGERVGVGGGVGYLFLARDLNVRFKAGDL